MSAGAETTKDLSIGAGENRIANAEAIVPGRPIHHEAVSDIAPGRLRLAGVWIHGPDFVEYAGGGEGIATITNTASRIAATLSSATGRPLTVGVREDGPPLDREWSGADAGEDPDHGCAIVVTKRRDYVIVRRDEAEMHELALVAAEPGLRIHGFEFR